MYHLYKRSYKRYTKANRDYLQEIQEILLKREKRKGNRTMTSHTPYLPKARRPKREHNGGAFWPGENPEVCVIEGKGYVVKTGPEQINQDGERFRELRTFCIGPVDEQGNRIDPAPAPATHRHENEPPKKALTAPGMINDTTPTVLTAPTGIGDVNDLIKKMAGDGMSTRQISAALAGEGVKLSHVSVSKRLQTVMF